MHVTSTFMVISFVPMHELYSFKCTYTGALHIKKKLEAEQHVDPTSSNLDWYNLTFSCQIM